MKKQIFVLANKTVVLANNYSEALDIKRTIKEIQRKHIEANKPDYYTINDSCIYADSYENALAIYQTIRNCVVNHETKCVKNFVAHNKENDVIHVFPFLYIEDNKEQNKESKNDSVYNHSNKGKFLNSIHNSSDYINAYNDYLLELKDSDFEAWKTETGITDNDSVFGNLTEYDFTYKFNPKEIDRNEIYRIHSIENNQERYSAICEYIANNQINVFISKAIVKNISGNIYNDCMEACLRIVNSRYQDVIFDDICNDVYIAIHNLVFNGFVDIDSKTGKLIFDTYTKENGKEYSYYFDLFRTVRQTFVSYKNGSETKEHILSECENVSDYADFVQSDKLANLIEKDTFKSFIHWLSVKDSKNFPDIIKVLSALLNCSPLNQIDGINKDRANYIKNGKLIPYYQEYFGKVCTRTVEYIKYDRKVQWRQLQDSDCYIPITVYIPRKDKKGNVKKGKYTYKYNKGHNYHKENGLNNRLVSYMAIKYKGMPLKKKAIINYPTKEYISFSNMVKYSTIKDRKEHTAYFPVIVSAK